MIGLAVKITDTTQAVKDAADKASFKNLGHAAASLRKTAAASIERSAEASAPGQPPHTRRGQLKRAFRFDVDKQKQLAVIGPMASLVGESAAAHEFGGEYKGEEFPARPFMLPAIEQSLDRFAREWENSIG